MNDIVAMSVSAQPMPAIAIPKSLLKALDTFMVAATYKRTKEADQNCAFLCHVSTRKGDHNHIEKLLRSYKTQLSIGLRSDDLAILGRLRLAYDDLATTHAGIKSTPFQTLAEAINFYSPGIAVKLVNGDTDEDVAVRSPYNLFVGGNKLGRGVTIKNLLVSYYGRNPRSPQADTVLQHARMYGYRRKDIGLLRLFLPPTLHTVFKAINKMEIGLRDLISKNSSEAFRAIYVETGLNSTRKNILAPGSVGVYAAGSNYNPFQVVRDNSVAQSTDLIDAQLKSIPDKGTVEIPLEQLLALIELTKPDESQSEFIWSTTAIVQSLRTFAKLEKDQNNSPMKHQTGYVYVDRDRGLEAGRRETAGIIEGGEFRAIAPDRIALFLLRTKASNGKSASWWPQIRFPNGSYAFAFAL